MKLGKGCSILIAVCIQLVTGLQVNAQENGDSLLHVWGNAEVGDAERMEALHTHIWNIAFRYPDSGFALSNQLLEMALKVDDKHWVGEAYNSLAVSEMGRGNFEKIREYNETGLEIARSHRDTLVMGKCISDVGNYYLNIGDVQTAYKCYQEGRRYNRIAGNKRSECYNIGNIGNVFLSLEDFKSAERCYIEQREFNATLNDPQTEVSSFSNMANVYLGLGDTVKAVKQWQKGILLAEKYGFKQFSANSHSNMAMHYLSVNDFDSASKHIGAIGALAEELLSPYLSAMYEGLKCLLLQKQSKDVKALSTCKLALQLAMEHQIPELKLGVLQALYALHKAKGKGDEALVFHEKLMSLKDSLNTDKAKTDIQRAEFNNQLRADSLAQAEKDQQMKAAHVEEMQASERNRNIGFGVALFFVVLSGGFYSRWRYIRKSRASLQLEKDRSENLLLNILPADIAEELKNTGKADARDFETVSILFTDFKDFTEQSAKLNAADLVNEINTCFEAFDGIMAKHSIEKIKTIGDSYMAAGGLPVPTDDSVKNTVLAALEMQAFIGARSAELGARGLPFFEMRVGIHTGPVVAGIVGVKKFQYDIWGDTVNTASRMESAGEVGKVNVSQATYELLKDDAEFVFESRGKIEAKGKGEMEMWFVEKTTQS